MTPLYPFDETGAMANKDYVRSPEAAEADDLACVLMCGIVGYFRLSAAASSPPPEAIERMRGAVRHRGPDGAGTHFGPGVGFGHARLSIIDLDGGAQPLANEDETVWITFNGEVFNHVELRRQLLARGHRFRTHSDTETIVHAYEDRGARCVDALNGDFAFGLWDARRE